MKRTVIYVLKLEKSQKWLKPKEKIQFNKQVFDKKVTVGPQTSQSNVVNSLRGRYKNLADISYDQDSY